MGACVSRRAKAAPQLRLCALTEHPQLETRRGDTLWHLTVRGGFAILKKNP